MRPSTVPTGSAANSCDMIPWSSGLQLASETFQRHKKELEKLLQHPNSVAHLEVAHSLARQQDTDLRLELVHCPSQLQLQKSNPIICLCLDISLSRKCTSPCVKAVRTMCTNLDSAILDVLSCSADSCHVFYPGAQDLYFLTVIRKCRSCWFRHPCFKCVCASPVRLSCS